MVYRLRDEYEESGLTFSRLSGSDLAVAEILRKMAQQKGFNVMLITVIYKEQGKSIVFCFKMIGNAEASYGYERTQWEIQEIEETEFEIVQYVTIHDTIDNTMGVDLIEENFLVLMEDDDLGEPFKQGMGFVELYGIISRCG